MAADMRLLLAILLLMVTSLSVNSAGLINIEVVSGPFPGFLCDNGSGVCLGGTAGYLLDTSSGRLLAN
jgi:hypothetical protein